MKITFDPNDPKECRLVVEILARQAKKLVDPAPPLTDDPHLLALRRLAMSQTGRIFLLPLCLEFIRGQPANDMTFYLSAADMDSRLKFEKSGASDSYLRIIHKFCRKHEIPFTWLFDVIPGPPWKRYFLQKEAQNEILKLMPKAAV